MDGRRLLHGVIDVTRLVVGFVIVCAAAAWAAAGARAAGAIIWFAGVGYLLAVVMLDPARREGSGTPRWNALAYLGTAREAVAWAAIVGLVVTLVLGLSSVGEPPWQFAAIVGPFVGAVVGCGLAIRRRFGSPDPSPT